MRDRSASIGTVPPHKRLAVEKAEHDIRIRHRRVVAARRIAGRAGNGPGALRSHLDRHGLVEPHDAAASGADFRDVDHRQLECVPAALHQRARCRDAAADLILVGEQHAALLDDRAFGGRAAHVEADQVAVAGRRAELARPNHARSRTAFDDLRRPVDHRVRGENSTRRLHHLQPSLEAAPGELVHQRAQIGLHGRADIGVDHRGAGPLILAHLRKHIDRQRNEAAGHGAAKHLADAPLMVGVRVGMQEADRNGLHLLGLEPRDRTLDAGKVQRRNHFAARTDTLLHFKPQAARHQRLRLDVERLIKTRHADAAELQYIAEAARGYERGLRALVLHDGVGRHRAAVQNLGDPALVELEMGHQLVDAADHRIGVVARR